MISFQKIKNQRFILKTSLLLFFLGFFNLFFSENVLTNSLAFAKNPDWQISETSSTFSVQILSGNRAVLESPPEGLWSIALDWENDAPARWIHVPATEKTTVGKTTVLSGKLKTENGELQFRDCYSLENGLLKCVRRFEYQGSKNLEKLTLSVRWLANGPQMQAFLPGILYYGNPSGEKNTPGCVPVYHGKVGEFAQFEEHRYPMPFACLEDAENLQGAALYTLPTPTLRGNVPDQYWSLGVKANSDKQSELVQYSGFVGYNQQNSVVKALQRSPMKYPESTMKMIPNTVIEKTFYLDVWNIERAGTAFQKPVEKALELYQPFAQAGLPSLKSILESKIDFAKSRWVEGKGFAGFNMYPSAYRPRLVMGWCGQAASPGFALQCLEDKSLFPFLNLSDQTKHLSANQTANQTANQIANQTENQIANQTTNQAENGSDWVSDAVQRSLDHLSGTPVDKDGFPVIFDISDLAWSGKDPVSMGQAMFNFAIAIRKARQTGKYDSSRWEAFLKKASDVVAARILDEKWSPRSTAEAFYIAPLMIASNLFKEDASSQEQYKKAAVKASEYYAKRHLSMKEPYWGGTLDANCEDKEGAWAAFQAFLTMYEETGEEKYLVWARHAGDVTISYTVVWDIPLPPGRLADHQFKTRGWTVVSPQNQHLDVFGVLFTPEIYKLGEYLQQDSYKKVSLVMYRSCGQLIDSWGSQGEQIQQTNFAQHGDFSDVLKLRGGYAEAWTVFWITAHFLNAAGRMTPEQVDALLNDK